ncbi:XRE family transcriptional regulator [uncultured Alcanivorax sp.]|uniref:LexA family protein n=1 Tax=uncultured Alcanivorax sp. TaxID=191215 RepID=UPI0032B25A5A
MSKRRELTPEELEWAARLKAEWNALKGELSLTQEIAATKMEITQGAVGQYLNGRIPLNDSAAMKFADLLGVDVGKIKPPLGKVFVQLSSFRNKAISNVDEAPSQHSSRTAPVISWVQAGEWTEAVDLHQPGYGDSYESVPDNSGPNVFWLRVVGDSMTSPSGASIPEGHLILVDPDRSPVSGSLVVAKLDDSQEVTFKKLVIDAGQKYLKPLNPDYKTIQINGNCRIVGVVIEAKVKF